MPIAVRGPLHPSQVDEIVREAESKIIAATPGAVPPHDDDGGHLPFGGSMGGTRGPSMFGKRKIVTSDSDPNPQALLLNFPPKPSEANIICWERNYRSNMYEDPSAEAVRFDSTNFNSFGYPNEPSYLADQQRSMGNLRRTANTRPTPSPAFYPPEREVEVPLAKCDYTWTWPKREKRAAPPQLKRCAARRRHVDPPPCSDPYRPAAAHTAASLPPPAHTQAQHSTAQHSTAQHSTAQHSTAQHSIAQHARALPLGSSPVAGRSK